VFRSGASPNILALFCRRCRCSLSLNGVALCTLKVSNNPMACWNPGSSMDRVACSGGSILPLKNMSMFLITSGLGVNGCCFCSVGFALLWCIRPCWWRSACFVSC